MQKLVGTLKQYAKMPSTWRGLAMLAGAFGVYLDPALLETAIAGVVAAIGLVETVRKD